MINYFIKSQILVKSKNKNKLVLQIFFMTQIYLAYL